MFDERDMKFLIEYASDQVKNEECLKSIIFNIKCIIKYYMNDIKNLEVKE